jgi:hypothetical protein
VKKLITVAATAVILAGGAVVYSVAAATTPPGYNYHPLLSPVRVVDTRTGLGNIQGPVLGGAAYAINAPAVCDTGDKALFVDVTVTAGTGSGYLSFGPDQVDPARITDTVVQWQAGQTVTGFTAVATPGVYYVHSSGTVQVIIDEVGVAC